MQDKINFLSKVVPSDPQKLMNQCAQESSSIRDKLIEKQRILTLLPFGLKKYWKLWPRFFPDDQKHISTN